MTVNEHNFRIQINKKKLDKEGGRLRIELDIKSTGLGT